MMDKRNKHAVSLTLLIYLGQFCNLNLIIPCIEEAVEASKCIFDTKTPLLTDSPIPPLHISHTWL